MKPENKNLVVRWAESNPESTWWNPQPAYLYKTQRVRLYTNEKGETIIERVDPITTSK